MTSSGGAPPASIDASDRGAIQKLARRELGLDRLRPGQAPAIRGILEGRDVLAVMPTGSGKSAIYQLAGQAIAGPTIVVSPLIALQKDQVESLVEEGMTAGAVNSQVGERRSEEAMAAMERGELEFLFLAPEQLAKEETIERLRAAGPTLLVVDEAHCISSWGHDFRPDYLGLGHVRDALTGARVLALTATASPPVRDEIVERLRLRDAKVVVSGFDRPNIWLGVERASDADDKQRRLVELVRAAPRPGIVYAATRKRTEELAAALGEGAACEPDEVVSLAAQLAERGVSHVAEPS